MLENLIIGFEDSNVLSQSSVYNSADGVIPAKPGIQIEQTGLRADS